MPCSKLEGGPEQNLAAAGHDAQPSDGSTAATTGNSMSTAEAIVQEAQTLSAS